MIRYPRLPLVTVTAIQAVPAAARGRIDAAYAVVSRVNTTAITLKIADVNGPIVLEHTIY